MGSIILCDRLYTLTYIQIYKYIQTNTDNYAKKIIFITTRQKNTLTTGVKVCVYPINAYA